MPPLIEITLSWSFIYFIMALPLILMTSNFIFGSCTVSEMIDDLSGKDSADIDGNNNSDDKDTARRKGAEQKAHHKQRRKLGKFITAVFFFVGLSQPFVFLGLVNGGSCNIGGLVFLSRRLRFDSNLVRWHGSQEMASVHDGLSGSAEAGSAYQQESFHRHSSSVGSGVCTPIDVLYLIMWFISTAMFVVCVMSNPSVKHRNHHEVTDYCDKRGGNSKEGATVEGRAAKNVPLKEAKEVPPRFPSYRCGTCNSTIAGHDHHCLFINNCVGSNNYSKFVLFLFLASANSFYILWNTVDIVFVKGTVVDCILGIFTYIVFFAITSLLVFHLVLIRKKTTTAYVLRHYKGPWAKLKFLLSP